MERVLIVNADDFGQTAAISRGICRAHQQGIVMSASLMVRWPAAASAVEYCAGLDLGLHIDLGEWTHRSGAWESLYERVQLEDKAAVEAEIQFQLSEFDRLTGKTPSHLDSHQHVHLQEPVRTVATRIAEELNVPLRGCSSSIQYCGEFYGQTGKGAPCAAGISIDALIKLVQELPIGVTELGCHPGEMEDGDYLDYCREREIEVEMLCHPRVRRAIREGNIRLCSFADLGSRCFKVEQPTSSRPSIKSAQLNRGNV